MSALHIVKLCVGAGSVDELRRWQDGRTAERRARGDDPRPRHVTRMWPKRADEVLAGGSLYWVVAGWISVRQAVEAFDEVIDADGIRRCAIVLSPELVPVSPRQRGPFQGWRYLAAGDAPPDARPRLPAGLHPAAGAGAAPGFAEEAGGFDLPADLPHELALALDGLGVPLQASGRGHGRGRGRAR